MAGAGYKLFVSGDVLTAAQVNTYLNEQTVMVFATSAARTSALSLVLAEGMMSYLQDSNTVFYYDGAAWNALASGDITAITAGTGISITSGTGPVPTVEIDTAVTVDKTTAQTLTNKTLTSPALTTPTISTLTTNGDLVYGTGSGALSRLGIGSSAQILTVASGIPSWATPAGGSTFSGCQIYLTSDTSLANATQATINWGSESFDTDSYHSTSTDTDRITIPAGKSGKFLVYGQWTIAAGTGYRGTDVRLNGSSYLHIGQVVNCSATAGDEPNMLFSFVADLVATDYLTMRIYQNSGASKTYFSQAYYTRFGVAYLGA